MPGGRRLAERISRPAVRETARATVREAPGPGTSDTMITHRCWTPVTKRARLWLDLWGPTLPLLVAEGTIWVGCGALLPTCFTEPAAEVAG